MKKRLFALISFFFLAALFAGAAEADVPAAGTPAPKRVVVIPVHGEINKANWYLFRRGVKKAAEEKADAIVLDVNTPGGELPTRFPPAPTFPPRRGKSIFRRTAKSARRRSFPQTARTRARR